ncbi:RloB-like protein [Pseudomonas congelans]|uniref:RloB-like protein n=1 Tax=Pseudomonas congelans TaxID=200452 RepID=A0A1H0VUU0_9PSED|nr:RloB family protein [Pseudomonas congelans]SDP81968.1 RloB-like protein [Pseudomonas congelans]
MARNIPPAPSLKRKTDVVDPKVEIYIVCEGKNTEPKYFEDCADYYGNGLVKVKPLRGAGVPMTIVQTAKELKEELIAARSGKKAKNSFDHCFRVWAVFDKDEHPEIDRALAIALESKIDVGFSNPCFELWPLLHLTAYGGQDGRHPLQKRLKKEMPNYDHDSEAIVDFGQIKDSFPIALDRAKALLDARASEQCIHGCPSTTVGSLVEKIIQNGKKWASRVNTVK